MSESIYEVVAQAARYWFLFLMALIVWRSYRWLVRDRKQRKKRLRLLPDAGFVGELVVQEGSPELPVGLALPVSVEGVLGSVRGDDVFVPVKGVAKKHLWFEFDEEEGLRVEPYARRRMEVDGATYTGRRAHACLSHGSRLTVGEAVLRLRMFAGFEQAGARSAPLPEEEGTEAIPQAGSAPPAVNAPLTPEAFAALAPEQRAAYQQQMQQFQQMQWMAAWQAFQTYQAQQAALAAGVSQAPAQPTAAEQAAVLSTAQGDFVAPPRQTAVKTILPATVADGRTTDGQEPSDPAACLGSLPADGAGVAPSADAHGGRRLRRNPLPPLEEVPGGVPAKTRHGDGQTMEETDTDGDFAPSGETPEDRLAFAPSATFYPPVMEDGTERFAPGDGLEAQTVEDWPYAAYPTADEPLPEGGDPAGAGAETADEYYEYADEDEAPRSLYVEPDEAEQAKRLLWDRYFKGGRRR